jgi:hypothetical protein
LSALPFRPVTVGVSPAMAGLLPALFLVRWKASECVMPGAHELPRRKQRGINRNIHNRPKGRGIKPLSFGGFNVLFERVISYYGSVLVKLLSDLRPLEFTVFLKDYSETIDLDLLFFIMSSAVRGKWSEAIRMSGFIVTSTL